MFNFECLLPTGLCIYYRLIELVVLLFRLLSSLRPPQVWQISAYYNISPLVVGKFTGVGDYYARIDSRYCELTLEVCFCSESTKAFTYKLGSYFFGLPDGTRYFVTMVILKDPPNKLSSATSPLADFCSISFKGLFWDDCDDMSVLFPISTAPTPKLELPLLCTSVGLRTCRALTFFLQVHV